MTGTLSVLAAMAAVRACDRSCSRRPARSSARRTFRSTRSAAGSVNAYGESKLAIERALPHVQRATGVRWTTLRYFNAAGADADGLIGEAHDPEIHLIPRAIAAATRGDDFTVFGDDYPTPDGTCIRDYVHVTDLADAHVRALRRLEAGGESRAYNLGTGTGVSVRQVLDAIARAAGRPVPHRVSGRRPGDPARLVAKSRGRSRARLAGRTVARRYCEHGLAMARAPSARLREPAHEELNRSRVNDLLRLLRYATAYRGRLVVAFGAMVFYALGSAYLAWLIKEVVDGLFAVQDGQASSVGSDIARGAAGVIGGQILLAYFLKGVGAYGSSFSMADVGQRVVRDLRNALHSTSSANRPRSSHAARRASSCRVSRTTSTRSRPPWPKRSRISSRESLAVLGYAALLFYLDWRLALVVVVAAPLVVYPLVRLGQRVRRTTRRGQEELEHVTHLATEAFAGQRIVKAFAAEEREAARFRRATQMLYRTNVKVTGSLAALPPVMEFIGGLAAVGALWFGATRIQAGALTAGDFAAFLAIGLHDVRPDQEAQPGQRRHPADDCRKRTYLRDARHAFGGQ